VRLPDDTDTSPLEDEFFRELAGGSVAETDPPRPQRPRPERPRMPLGGTDPHGPHPLAAPVPSHKYRNGSARSPAALEEPPPRAPSTVGELRSDRRGRLRAAIALDQGAARKLLIFSYLAYGEDAVPAAIARAQLEVEAPISRRARRPRARPGDRVELHGDSAPQARLRLLADPPGGSGWQTLAKVRAGGDGRWLAEVRFPPDAVSGRYRARVAASPRHGYLAAACRALGVEVR
jgi:hypothetical protein